MNRSRIGALVVALSLVPLASAQVLVLTEGQFWVYSEARAISSFVTDGDSGTRTQDSFSASASALASEDDPDLGAHSAGASGFASWTLQTLGQTSSLSGGANGSAESVSGGLDASAVGGGSVSLTFMITDRANGTISSSGTSASDLYIYDGSSFVPFITGFNGTQFLSMEAGLYRWDAAAVASVSGTNVAGASVSYDITMTAVPEPASLFALSMGALGLLARRRAKPERAARPASSAEPSAARMRG